MIALSVLWCVQRLVVYVHICARHLRQQLQLNLQCFACGERSRTDAGVGVGPAGQQQSSPRAWHESARCVVHTPPPTNVVGFSQRHQLRQNDVHLCYVLAAQREGPAAADRVRVCYTGCGSATAPSPSPRRSTAVHPAQPSPHSVDEQDARVVIKREEGEALQQVWRRALPDQPQYLRTRLAAPGAHHPQRQRDGHRRVPPRRQRCAQQRACVAAARRDRQGCGAGRQQVRKCPRGRTNATGSSHPCTRAPARPTLLTSTSLI